MIISVYDRHVCISLLGGGRGPGSGGGGRTQRGSKPGCHLQGTGHRPVQARCLCYLGGDRFAPPDEVPCTRGLSEGARRSVDLGYAFHGCLLRVAIGMVPRGGGAKTIWTSGQAIHCIQSISSLEKFCVENFKYTT